MSNPQSIPERTGPRPGLARLACVFVLMLAPAVFASDPAVQALNILRSDGVRVRLDVEIANSTAQRTRGLMHRATLAPRAGMLFDFARAIRIRMWMKDTLIPLDMLFIDDDGSIMHIEPRTEPHSTALIEAPQPVRYVLEINGGAAADLAITPGDRVLLGQ